MLEKIELINEMASELEQKLLKSFGPMIYGEVLYKSLGYTTADAFRQAISRNTVPVDVFSIPHRRGKFALTPDIARWIAEQKVNHITKGETLEEKN